VETARWAEEHGLDGLLLADSQNLNAELWVELALAAAATRRLRLGPGVTNPATRHPAVTASAAATLHAESGGRAVLGLGRGDSALRQIGRAPVHVSELEAALVAIQAYLRGEDARLAGVASRLAWLADSPKPPVAVAASGPAVIEAGARHAELVDFTVGAELDRLRWAIGVARSVSDSVSLGAYLNVAVDPDPARARELVRGSAGIFARFSAEGSPAEGLSEVTRAGIRDIAQGYDEARHGQAAAVHSRQLDDEFVERFTVAGTAEQVAERLLEISRLGIERVVVVPCSLDTDPATLQRSNQRFADEVLPRLR
jgi:5,10-methylenetetrahydromethanopterin reductase